MKVRIEMRTLHSPANDIIYEVVMHAAAARHGQHAPARKEWEQRALGEASVDGAHLPAQLARRADEMIDSNEGCNDAWVVDSCHVIRARKEPTTGAFAALRALCNEAAQLLIIDEGRLTL